MRAAHGGEPLPIPLQIVRGKTQESRGRRHRGDLPRRFDGQGERADQESLGRIQLAVGNDLGADPIDLMQHLRQRAVRHLRASLERGFPVAHATVPAERRVGAVGPALLLTQDEKQPRVRPAAEHMGRNPGGKVARVRRQEGRVPHHDVRLRGAGPVDEQNIGAPLRRHAGLCRRRGWRASPGAERAVGELASLGQGDVPGADQECARRPQPLAGKSHDVVARDRLERRGTGRTPVGVAAVDLLLECARGDSLGL